MKSSADSDKSTDTEEDPPQDAQSSEEVAESGSKAAASAMVTSAKKRSSEHSTKPGASSKKARAEQYSAVDVLLGRGKRLSDHKGNKSFREKIRLKREEYSSSWKFQKGEMAQQVLDAVAKEGGRFLEVQQGEWREASHAKALEKAAQALREKKWDRLPSMKKKGAKASVEEMEDVKEAPKPSKAVATKSRDNDDKIEEESKPGGGADSSTDEPNQHISETDMKSRIRAGTRVSVYKDGKYVSGKIAKRAGSRILVQFNDNDDVEAVDLTKDLIRIDSRKNAARPRKSTKESSNSKANLVDESSGNEAARAGESGGSVTDGGGGEEASMTEDRRKGSKVPGSIQKASV